MTPRILKLCTKSVWGGCLAHQSLCRGTKNPRFPLCGRLGGPHLWSGCFGKEISRFLLPVVQTRLLGFPAV